MNPYPATYFARGITRKECFFGDKIKACVFEFDRDVRPDGNREMSIVWLINRDSVDYAKKQKNKKGEIQFKLGFAIVNNTVLDSLIKENNGRLSHTVDHPPHGLILSDLEKIELKMISQHLAQNSRYVSYSDEIPYGSS